MAEVTVNKRRGPVPRNLAHSQIVEFLELVKSGEGRATASTELKIGSRTIRNLLRDHPDITAELAAVKDSRLEQASNFMDDIVTSEFLDPALKLCASIAYPSRADELLGGVPGAQAEGRQPLLKGPLPTIDALRGTS